MTFEQTAWGGRFPDRAYFPMYLANGVDAVLINIMGSGDYNGEYQDDDMGACYTYMRSLGWYKSDRRTHTGTTLVYGTMYPLLEFAADALLNGDAMVPRDTRQYFDPETATLTTFYEQMDHNTLEWLRVKVTTFMTAEHILVEHYEVREAPAAGAAFTFILSSPLHPYGDYYKPVVTMERVELRVSAADALLEYRYAFESFRGGAFSWFDVPCAGIQEAGHREQHEAIGKATTAVLNTGAAVTRYLAVVDNEDAADVESELARLRRRCREEGYERLRAAHAEDWRRYFQTSRVALPDPAAQHVYNVGRYLLRADQHPQSGFLPVGLLPYLWQGVMFWDASFGLEALLGCGNAAEARRIIAHLRHFMPEARALAQSQQARGARLEWTVTSRDFTDYGWPTTQYHNNAVWAHAAFLCYAYSGDRAVLREHFELIEEYLVFMVDHCLVDAGGYLVVGQCQGVDESVSNKKVNDTWTNAVTLRALMDYRQTLALLQRESAITGLEGIIERLSAGLEKNVDAQGVMQSFTGGRVPNFGSLIYHLFPQHQSLRATLDKMMENYDPVLDMYNFHGVNRYAEKMFPWANYWAARCWAMTGDAKAGLLVKNALAAVNYFGGLPERVYYHGELYNNWLSTAHAAMILSINSMLAYVTGDTLRVLSGADETWDRVTFESIHAGEGLVVSASIVGKRLVRLDIDNRRPEVREIKVCYGNETQARLVRLAPGMNYCNAG